MVTTFTHFFLGLNFNCWHRNERLHLSITALPSGSPGSSAAVFKFTTAGTVIAKQQTITCSVQVVDGLQNYFYYNQFMGHLFDALKIKNVDKNQSIITDVKVSHLYLDFVV